MRRSLPFASILWLVSTASAQDVAESEPEDTEVDVPLAEEPATEEPAVEEPAVAVEEPVVAETPRETVVPEPAPEPPGQVRAQPPFAIQYQSLSAVRYNPLGLVSFLDLAGRVRLYESDSDILKQNFVGLGVVAGLSPAWGRFGLLVEAQPLTILRLYMQYELVGYFSTFNLLPSFPSPNADFSDTAISERGDMGLPGYATYGGQTTIGATLQIKLGPFAARNLFRAIHGSYQLRAGDRVYYDQVTDMLHPNDGWTILNDVDALAVFDVGLAIGARWTYSHAFYDAGHFEPGEEPVTPDTDIHRLGLIAAYTIEDNRGARFDRPTILLIAQWNLVHRYRTGADVHVGIPYLALAFQFTGDLLADH
jgi:hypothetical protein